MARGPFFQQKAAPIGIQLYTLMAALDAYDALHYVPIDVSPVAGDPAATLRLIAR